jgi:hypothetical protein
VQTDVHLLTESCSIFFQHPAKKEKAAWIKSAINQHKCSPEKNKPEKSADIFHNHQMLIIMIIIS